MQYSDNNGPLLLARAVFQQTPEEVKAAATLDSKLSLIGVYRMFKVKVLLFTLIPLVILILNILTKHYYPTLFHRDNFFLWYAVAGFGFFLYACYLLLPTLMFKFWYVSTQVESYQKDREPNKPFDIQFYNDVIVIETPQFETHAYWESFEIKHLGKYLAISLNPDEKRFAHLKAYLDMIYIPIDALNNHQLIFELALSRTLANDYRPIIAA